MKTTVQSRPTSLIFPLVLGIILYALIFAMLSGASIPLLNSPRAGMIAVLILGMAACALGGIGRVAATGRWASPSAILGYLLGVAILVVALSLFTGWKIPLIASEQGALVAAAVLIGVKYLIAIGSDLLHLG